MRKLLCRLGRHSWFRQWDKWGDAEVCRYCLAVRDEHPKPSVQDHTDGGA